MRVSDRRHALTVPPGRGEGARGERIRRVQSLRAEVVAPAPAIQVVIVLPREAVAVTLPQLTAASEPAPLGAAARAAASYAAHAALPCPTGSMVRARA